jgi:glutathione S-transferase
MRLLYHLWLSPGSRKVRVALAEKSLEFSMKVEKLWERRPEFVALNPACEVPVLVEADGSVLADDASICEYLEERYPEKPLLGTKPLDRAETRRIVSWFDGKMAREVTDGLVNERIMKRFLGFGVPDTAVLRASKANLGYHLEYVSYLAERRRWLAGEEFSLADIAAASHLSAIDYLGEIPWDEHPQARDWYARVKSRPSFRPILSDLIPGAPPPKHYADLDF